MPNKQRPPEGTNVDQEGLGIKVGMTIEAAERVLLEATLQQTKNNKTRAAATLGISTKTLHSKLKQYKIEDTGRGVEELSRA